MKVPITDKFLWAVYNFYETLDEVLDPPEIFKLRGWKNMAPLDLGFWKKLRRKKEKRQFAQFIIKWTRRPPNLFGG